MVGNNDDMEEEDSTNLNESPARCDDCDDDDDYDDEDDTD